MTQTPLPDPQDARQTQVDAAPLELGYAPMAKAHNRAFFVLLTGLITTALTLAGVYALQRYAEINIMGFYLDYIIPVGAVIVGLAASSGYAYMSWQLGVRIRKDLLWIIVLLLLVSYFAAEYVSFRSRGPLSIPTGQTVQLTPGRPPVTLRRPLGFWEYFHLKAVNWTWKKEDNQKGDNEPLGMLGYVFVGLGVLGFSLSGLIIPGIVGQTPYCELCEQYMRTRKINLFPAVAVPAKKSAPDAPPPKFEEAEVRANRVVSAAVNNDAAAFIKDSQQDPAEIKAAGKQPRRLQIDLTQCGSCSAGFLQPTWLSGQGKQLRKSKLQKQHFSPEFGRDIRAIE